ncbi:peptidoglycan D,D-transpeptidase FtsI family protein [Paenibacillus silvae]|uniref:peptidoglycan D,D-transpeptidase FtsI family protein n=1 Tax=Paenibacillus silvae TaxID=1325358 RepID=UPI0020037D4D|nr:penicillin-binding transpeptidase domain-containing protein [Paenibacillus silvae]MCK6076308.1 penicillin-binding protein 2 [Paenibacillus silvae]MCK6078337.1 penicillin-binding protein 2 [Paenibacillus silvae]MCK6150533.1 penicillin-binding protein 2 [Paenibacillus silvae]MCK6268793.1 penicillin-binding protein 2 [Paenibacillus silvae]MCK6270386.1 penicillin-binding protein 2 [Paenibacillus silvae]
MKKHSNEKDELADKRRFSYRMNVFFFASFIIFSVIIVRLAYLQFVEGPELSQEEASNITKDVPLAPVRGTIYDSTGTVKLAYSKPIQSLYLTLYKNYGDVDGQPNPKIGEVQEMAARLNDVFEKYKDPNSESLTVDQIIEEMDLNSRKANGFMPRLIKSDLSEGEVAYFLQHKDEFKGIQIVEESVRYYDPDTVAVQTIGYLKKFKSSKSLKKYQEVDEANKTQTDPGLVYTENEFVGFDGLEFQYQDKLRGKSGYTSVDVDLRNLPEGVAGTTPPQKGYDLISSINKNVQVKTEQAIMDQLSWLHRNPVSGKLHPNAKTGFAVAMEVDTGKIVAAASMPDYDTNVWRTGSISTEDYDKIKYIYQNGTIRGFPPDDSRKRAESVVLLGSTIKPLSVLIGLKEGFFTTNTVYIDRGSTTFGGDNRRVQNSSGHVYGAMRPHDAIRHSSNVFMIDEIGKKLYSQYGAKGVDVWDKYMEQFGLGVKTGVDLPNEYPGYKEYIESSESSLTKLAYASFGQQGKYTTMQLAQYTTMLANKGKRMEPQLVKEFRDSEGNVVEKVKPKVLSKVDFSDAYWNEVQRGMATEVSSFSGFPYDFARKTGTSTQNVGGKLVDNGVFIAYAPRNNPKLAVAVVIPEGGFGSNSAAPVARAIFDAYDQEFGLDGIPKKNQNKETETNTP